MKRTTGQAARAAKISRATLQFWIASGKIAAPDVQLVGGKAVRLWTADDIRAVRKFKGTLKPGPMPRRSKAAKKMVA